MLKTYHFSALIAISLSSVAGAWGQTAPINQVENKTDIHFPLNSSQAWGIEESLLIWKAYEDDTDFAFHNTNKKNSIKHPTFDWSTGVRLKLTRYLPSNDPWDVNVIATYYYDQADKDVEVNFSDTSVASQNILQSTWNTNGVGSASKAQAYSQMNFFTFDLTAGRYYSLTRKVEIHPYIGIRSVLNYQTYKATYHSIPISSNPSNFTTTRFKGRFDFWGVGPRVGTDVALSVGRHWSLIGMFGASLFGGRYDVNERFTAVTSSNQNLKDKDTVLRSNIDASLGLGWEKWVRKGTVRIAPSFVFEVSEWFSMKRWIDSHFDEGVTLQYGAQNDRSAHTHRRYSDLGLMGFNINLQVDF